MKRLRVAALLLVAMSVLAALMATGSGAAQEVDVGDMALTHHAGPLSLSIDMLYVFIFLTILTVAVLALFWKKITKLRWKVAAALVAGSLIAVTVVNVLPAPGGVPPGDVPPDTPFVVTSFAIPTTEQGSVIDTAAEIIDSQNGDGDGGTPTPTLCAFGTNAFESRLQNTVRWDFTIDNDVATSVAGFSAPDMCAHQVEMKWQGIDANGDSANDLYHIYGRVKIAPRVTGTDHNDSNERNFVYWDSTFGTYAAFGQVVDTAATDGEWYSAWPAGASPNGRPPADQWSPWIDMGQTNGDDVDYFPIALVFNNYGPYAYERPLAGETYTVTWQVAGPDFNPNICILGGVPNSTCQITWNLQLFNRD